MSYTKKCDFDQRKYSLILMVSSKRSLVKFFISFLPKKNFPLLLLFILSLQLKLQPLRKASSAAAARSFRQQTMPKKPEICFLTVPPGPPRVLVSHAEKPIYPLNFNFLLNYS